MTDETYEGWRNRESWAVNLWLANDEGLYLSTLERVADAVDGVEGKEARVGEAAVAVQTYVQDLLDPAEELMTAEMRWSMASDVGSLWRVDWREVGAHWLPEAQ